MVNVRCQACQAKYRLLAAKRVDLLGLVLGDVARPKNDGAVPRFPYRPPIQRRARSYIVPAVNARAIIILTVCNVGSCTCNRSIMFEWLE